MQYVSTGSPAEIKAAGWPHGILLINPVFNHIFIFVASLSVTKSFPLEILLTPVISFAITGYIMVRQRQIRAGDASLFLKGRWKIAATRNHLLINLLIFTCLITGGGLPPSNIFVWPKTATILMQPIIGGAVFSFMIALLVLIILGSDSMNIARNKRLPEKFPAKNPSPETESH